MDGISMIAIDAVPQRLPVNRNENTCNQINIENLLNGFSVDDYKSAFFLLMDVIGPTKFLALAKKDKPFLKNAFIDLYSNDLLDASLLVELLGSLKMYNKLRMLGTCYHVYESTEKSFNKIHQIWKTLYSLCEELTDEEFKILRQNVPSNDKDKILSAEDWFCWALQTGLFSRTDLSNLENIFKNYPSCLNILKSYPDYELYNIRTSTPSVDCGIALIINNDIFDEKSPLQKRESSYKDVSSLIKLWDSFGFKTVNYENLSYSETFEVMKTCASLDHSNFDVFVCCILSHGESNAVYSSDGKLMSIPDLLAPVVNECSSLTKKPKLFFIQACQGRNFHEGPGKPVYYDKAADMPATEPCYSSLPPVYCDTLIVNSSIDGYVSFRDKEGSWFFQTLCKQMMKYGDNTPIEEVMRKVSKEVTKFSTNSIGPWTLCQIVPRQSTLEKTLILKKRDLKAAGS